MTPMFAACTSQMVPSSSDLVFIEFAVNDLHRGDGALAAQCCQSGRVLLTCVYVFNNVNPDARHRGDCSAFEQASRACASQLALQSGAVPCLRML